MSTAFAHVVRVEVENMIAIAHVRCAADKVVSTIPTAPVPFASAKAEPTTRIAVVPHVSDVASPATSRTHENCGIGRSDHDAVLLPRLEFRPHQKRARARPWFSIADAGAIELPLSHCSFVFEEPSHPPFALMRIMLSRVDATTGRP